MLNLDTFSKIGDGVGGIIGSIFGLITIVLVCLTYKYQKQELASQKKELEEQRLEFKRTRTFDLVYRELKIIDDHFDDFSQEQMFHKYKEYSLHRKIGIIVSDFEFLEKELRSNLNIESSLKLVNKVYGKSILHLLNVIHDRLDNLEIIVEPSFKNEVKIIIYNSLPHRFRDLVDKMAFCFDEELHFSTSEITRISCLLGLNPVELDYLKIYLFKIYPYVSEFDKLSKQIESGSV